MGQLGSSEAEPNPDPSDLRLLANNTNVTTPSPMPGDKWYYNSLEECLEALGPAAYGPSDGGLYCNGTWDAVLCWRAVPANATTRMPCPPLRGLDSSKYGYKKCTEYGTWAGQTPGDPNPWTNYTNCYTAESKKIYEDIFSKSSPEVIKKIAYGCRILEMTGLSLSIVSLAISLFIFWNFRSLRCDRTRIHRNLFLAIIIHVGIVLSVHVDKFIALSLGDTMQGIVVAAQGTIYDTKVLCETLYTLVEYTKTVMFMWMFLEGMYLHNMLVVSVFSSGKPKYWLYYTIGWGFPVLLTGSWATTMGLIHTDKCWFGYTFRSYFWILEGPRAAIISVNLIFLLNIVRVLVTKLRESNSTEAVQVRKAVKAAIVLLPLLGANNFLAFVDPPTEALKFGIWCYTSQFLISFQGFFISLLYCFLNGEVQATLRKHWERYHQSRGGYASGRQRPSRTMSMFTTVSESPHQLKPDAVVLANLNGHNQNYCELPIDDVCQKSRI